MSSSPAYALRPWTDVVRPHDDIRSGDLALGTYAANLAQVAMTHEAAPVYGDAQVFFAATYFTPTMCGLLGDVFGALAGQRGDRVVQLKTPFGGGKTHSLLALFHLARSRVAAASVPELDGVADPGAVRVAVLSGEWLDPARGREVEGRVIRTLWGELAFQLGGWPAYERLLVEGDEGPPPAGQRLGELLTGSPALVLLDEVLVYAAKAKSLRIGDSTMDRQVLLFLQHLTEAVNQQPCAALVYSLQASVGEAVGEEGLLEALEKIAGRIDERREPVSGDEVLRVVQRRLFADVGDTACAQRWRERTATCWPLSCRPPPRLTATIRRPPRPGAGWSSASSSPTRSTRSCWISCSTGGARCRPTSARVARCSSWPPLCTRCGPSAPSASLSRSSVRVTSTWPTRGRA